MPQNEKEPLLGPVPKMNTRFQKNQKPTNSKPFDLTAQPISKTDIVVNVSLGDDDMDIKDTKDTTFNVHVAIPFSNVIRRDGFELWVERLTKIQKEHSCNCNLVIKD